MAITATAMAKKGKRYLIPVFLSLPFQLIAAEWETTPRVSIKETYSDNVTPTQFTEESSTITTATVGLSSSVSSKILSVEFQADYSSLYYTHDSQLNNDYTELSLSSSLAPWTNGPKLVATASINNIPRNVAGNAYADLLSFDTVQSENYQVGLIQSLSNSSFNFHAQANVYERITEDNIGESNGYDANISFSNGRGIKNSFWRLNSRYLDRENEGSTARNYSIDARYGITTSFNFNPFIRYFDEGFSGSGTASTQTINDGESLGAGFRLRMIDRLILDISYNFILDKESDADDYIAANFDWEPTSRTAIKASYNQRFYGDAYQFQLTHKNRRLVNNISYNETLQAFSRDSFETTTVGSVWCPIGVPFDINNCELTNANLVDPSQYVEVPLIGQRPVEDNQFSLVKQLTWSSSLSYSRTTFNLNVSNREVENLESGLSNKYLTMALRATRNISARSSFYLSYRFSLTEFNAGNTNSSLDTQDYYRISETGLNRTLAQDLSLSLSFRHLNRSSSVDFRDYQENRVSLSLRKDF